MTIPPAAPAIPAAIWPGTGDGSAPVGGAAHPRTYLDPLFENLPVAVIVVDPADRVVRANPAFLRMFGFTAEQLLGKSVTDLIVPDWLRHEASVQARNALHGRGTEVETVRRRRDGSLVDVSMRRVAVEADGAVIALYGIYQDISEQKRREAERHDLLERERREEMPSGTDPRRERIMEAAGVVLREEGSVEEVLVRLARFLVPELADSCIVYLREPSGVIRRLDLAFADPGQAELLREQLQHYPPELSRLIPPVARTLHTGEPQLLPDVSIGALKAVPGDSGHISVALLLGLTSLLVVPLTVDEQVFGALSLGTAESGRRYHADDLLLTEEIARLAARGLAPRIREARRLAPPP
jgi:PAS domain S-box-containing protein